MLSTCMQELEMEVSQKPRNGLISQLAVSAYGAFNKTRLK